MLSGPPKRDRQVVPRWRPLVKTPVNEFAGSNTAPLLMHRGKEQLDHLKNLWTCEPNLGLASEVLSLAVLFEDHKLSENASQFILAQPRSSESLARYARNFLQRPNQTVESIKNPLGLAYYRSRIALSKKQLNVYPRDVFIHLDLARLYASSGQNKGAVKHIEVALALAPQDRFVIRAVARYFVHSGELDRATALFDAASKDDPWIVATQIAVADISGRGGVWSKAARAALARQLHPSQITELAASLGTVEAKSGARRRANKLFRTAALMPNDNAVAQLHWAYETHHTGFNEQWLSVERSYEARAGHAFLAGHWRDAEDNCELWLRDEPFSARPAELGLFIASEFLKDYEKALAFAEAALIANPKNPSLHNDHAFCLALVDRLDQASEALNRAARLHEDGWKNAVVNATRGLIHFRQGDIDSGRRYYEIAVTAAVQKKAKSTAELALIHWLHEEIRSGFSSTPHLIQKLRSYFANKERDHLSRRVFHSLIEVPLAETRSEIVARDVESTVNRMLKNLDWDC